jgi:predicted nucleic acid-binding protein
VRVYLDASVIVPTLVQEPGSDAVDNLIEQLSEPPFLSSFVIGETASALARLARMEKLTAADVRDRLASFDRWVVLDAEVIETEPTDVRLAGLFVRRLELGLRMPDAIHIATAQRIGAALATLDVRLAGAASALNVSIKVPG